MCQRIRVHHCRFPRIPSSIISPVPSLQISPYPTSLALVMEEFLEMDLGEGAFPSYSESDRYRKDSRRPCECSPLTWLCSTSGARANADAAPPPPPAIGDEEVPPPASTSKL